MFNFLHLARTGVGYMVLTFKKFMSWFLEAGLGLSLYESHGLNYTVQAACYQRSRVPVPCWLIYRGSHERIWT